ncbi:MAG: PDZ domain-containing protein [Gemmatimonadota bacterium]
MRRCRLPTAAAMPLAMIMAASGSAAAQTAGGAPVPATVLASAPVENIRYALTFDSAAAAERTVRVRMTFEAPTAEPVLLSLPVWTPGAYEVSNFARRVSAFTATADGQPVEWDKVAPSTWRVRPGVPGTLSVSFLFRADTLDNAMSWSAPDFLLLNGTNVFLHPTGRELDFHATVRVTTEPHWEVATGMPAGPEAGSYVEDSYHDLVDMPFFIGALELDSIRVDGRWNRLATYPRGALTGDERRELWRQIARMTPVQAAVFGETPWESYTTLLLFTDAVGGGSALEHQNSHVGIYHPGFVGSVVLPLITGHEIFHAWNVKRLRPAELWPYRYQEAQPTPWLWVSEGLTDYYADLTLVRAAVAPPEILYALIGGKIQRVMDAPPVALEDASLSSWISPVDGTAALYYDKGSLAGLMMDVLLRHATANRVSLDHVLRELYAATYQQGRGFEREDFWGIVGRLAPGVDWSDFERRYVDGREPYPWDEILPKAALQLVIDAVREPRIGVTTTPAGERLVVTEVSPGSSAAAAGVRAGDVLLRVGEIQVSGPEFGPTFRERYAGAAEGAPLVFGVERNGAELLLDGALRFEVRMSVEVRPLADAPPGAQRILMGILQGVVDR